MPSSGFRLGQGRNTTAVVGANDEVTSRITFWSVRTAQCTINYRTDKGLFLQEKEKEFHPLLLQSLAKSMEKKTVKMGGGKNFGFVQALMP